MAEAISVRLSPEHREWAQDAADEQGMTLSEFVRRAILTAVDVWLASMRSSKPTIVVNVHGRPDSHAVAEAIRSHQRKQII